jgi:hypothetical protein
MSRPIKPITIATELSGVEAQIEAIERALKPLIEQKEALRGALLENLRVQGVKTLKLDNGTIYVRAFRTTLKVHDDHEAMQWAAANNSLKVDTTKAMKILKLTGQSDNLPAGFERQDTEYLTVKSGKDAE